MNDSMKRIAGFLIFLTSFKIVRIMRNTLLLSLIAVIQVFAAGSYAQKTTLSLDMDQVALKSVLHEIENKSEFYFLYNTRLVDDTRKVDAHFDEKEIGDVLASLFRDSGVEYLVLDRQILLSPGPQMGSLKKEIQPVTVTGTVSDESGEPLPGVTIYMKGTTRGTVTDGSGNYTIEVPDPTAVLVFSYVGYEAQEITVGGRTEIDVSLTSDVLGIDELVVIGYGSQIKKNLSSAVSKVDAEKLANAPVASFEAGLQGRAAGVQVTTSSALGGSAIRIRVRGTSSASANSEPLYVIDGIPVESGEISSSQPGAAIKEWNLQQAANTNVLASLNPADIESIEILKDAAASAIYGSRGANGVVLITTKGGKAGKTQIRASATFGISEATHRIPLLNSEQYIEVAQEAWANMYQEGVETGNDWLMDRYDISNDFEKFWSNSGVLVDGLTKEEALNTDTDWIDEALQTGVLQEYNVSASGGNEKTTFYISANLKDESTILRGNEYQRFGTRINLEHQLGKRIRAGAKMMLTHVDDQQVPTSWAGGIGSVQEMLPIWPVYKEDGTYFNLYNKHPVAGVDLREIHLTSNQVLGNWFLSANLLEGLSFRTEFGANLLFNDDFHYRDGRITSHGRTVSSTVIGNRTSWNWKNVLNYKKRIENHSVDLLLATDMQQFNQKINTIYGDTYFNSALQKPIDAALKNAVYLETGYVFLSYIGRFNYDFKSRYLLAFSMRADGSSRFAGNNRWGYFPAASVGYILSEEEYFSSLKGTFNFFKIRASYGIVGNAEIGDHSYISTYQTSTYNSNTGILLSNLGDDQLGWESTAQFDVGVTWEAFNGRLSGEIDYYSKHTTDLLLPFPVSNMTGVTAVTRNVGELKNTGVEIMLNTLNVRGRNFTWETNITLAHNENEVLALSEDLGEGLSFTAGLANFSLYPGKPVGVTEMVEWAGVDPETGQDTYVDTDGNVLLISELYDQYGSFNNFYNEHKKPMGNPWPKISGGIDNRFTYKNWYLNVMFTYAAGQDFIRGDQKTSLAAFGSAKTNPTEFILERWQEPGDDAPVSKLRVENIDWTTTSEHLHRTDYIRLKDLTIGYRVTMGDGSFLDGLNIYAKVTNLLTFTKAPEFFWDPEFTGVVQSRSQNNMNAGTTYQAAPQARFFMAGVSLDF